MGGTVLPAVLQTFSPHIGLHGVSTAFIMPAFVTLHGHDEFYKTDCIRGLYRARIMSQSFSHPVDFKKKLFRVAPLFLALYSSLSRLVNKMRDFDWLG